MDKRLFAEIGTLVSKIEALLQLAHDDTMLKSDALTDIEDCLEMITGDINSGIYGRGHFELRDRLHMYMDDINSILNLKYMKDKWYNMEFALHQHDRVGHMSPFDFEPLFHDNIKAAIDDGCNYRRRCREDLLTCITLLWYDMKFVLSSPQ